MKAILMSIHPKWCEKIFDKEKTFEVRKTAPKLETPFKVYVYCTKERMTRVPSMYAYLHKNEPRACAEYGTIETWGEIGDVIANPHLASKHVSFGMHGKVIGSFVCDWITEITPHCDIGGHVNSYVHGYPAILGDDCLSFNQLKAYLGNKKGYDWDITEPKLFDKPRKLSEFRTPFACETGKEIGCWNDYCKNHNFDCVRRVNKRITRPPQSWCYVEEEK